MVAMHSMPSDGAACSSFVGASTSTSAYDVEAAASVSAIAAAAAAKAVADSRVPPLRGC